MPLYMISHISYTVHIISNAALCRAYRKVKPINGWDVLCLFSSDSCGQHGAALTNSHVSICGSVKIMTHLSQQQKVLTKRTHQIELIRDILCALR